MKNRWKKILSAVLLSGSLCLGSAAAAVPADEPYINDYLYELRQDEAVKQVLFVNIGQGTSAHIVFMEKEAENGAWMLTRSCDGVIGKNGGGKTVEGDMKTPYGVFNIRQGFGIKPNPGTSLPYTQVTEDTYACGCELYYNQIIDAEQTGHACEYGEHMIEYSPYYNYGLAIDYNRENQLGLGSAIFIHCMARPWTSGCVALPEEDMKYILQHCDAHAKVVIRQYIAP